MAGGAIFSRPGARHGEDETPGGGAPRHRRETVAGVMIILATSAPTQATRRPEGTGMKPAGRTWADGRRKVLPKALFIVCHATCPGPVPATSAGHGPRRRAAGRGAETGTRSSAFGPLPERRRHRLPRATPPPDVPLWRAAGRVSLRPRPIEGRVPRPGRRPMGRRRTRPRRGGFGSPATERSLRPIRPSARRCFRRARAHPRPETDVPLWRAAVWPERGGDLAANSPVRGYRRDFSSGVFAPERWEKIGQVTPCGARISKPSGKVGKIFPLFRRLFTARENPRAKLPQAFWRYVFPSGQKTAKNRGRA